MYFELDCCEKDELVPLSRQTDDALRSLVIREIGLYREIMLLRKYDSQASCLCEFSQLRLASACIFLIAFVVRCFKCNSCCLASSQPGQEL